MTRQMKWKLFLILFVTALGFFFVLPTVTDELPAWLKDIYNDKIKLGLDLQGGMHLVLEVQTRAAVDSSLERIGNNLRKGLKRNGIRFLSISRSDHNKLELLLPINEKERLYEYLNENHPHIKSTPDTIREGSATVILSLTDRESRGIGEFAVEQAVETIRNRIDEFGVTEPSIRRQGDRRILVQLPGVSDPRRAINLIRRAALLEFKLLNDETDITLSELKDAIERVKEENPDVGGDIVKLNEGLRDLIPEDSEMLFKVDRNPETGRTIETPFILKKEALLTGDMLKDARVAYGNMNEPYVSLTFNSQGARLFDELTGENVGRLLAIVLDKKVHSAPRIRERISGGRAMITGNFTTEEAHDLAVVLRAGSLPAPVEILEKRSVGPSLGSDSIRKGIISIIVGGILVVIFMFFYYRVSGVIVDLALALNIIFILGILSAFQATLTLPGIAGIVLTIGMAVDANVIIFERVREELKVGKTPSSAIKGGYSKALMTILDANITTLIAALILFQFGTGPIRGFAVTLSVGILTSLFTALVATRTLMELLVDVWGMKRLSI